MSSKIVALLGLGVALLFAVPIVGTVSARTVQTPADRTLPNVPAPVVNIPGNVPTTPGGPVTFPMADGYSMVVMPPLATRTDFYGGSTIPVMFQLYDQNGNPVTDATATLWVNGQAAIASGNSSTGNMFRFDPSGMMYVYNLNTKPYPAGPGSPDSTITIKAMVGTTTLTQVFIVSLD